MGPSVTLADRLEAALLAPADDVEAVQSTADRILDAATRRFVQAGIGGTTMSSIAAEAGLSREWLYRHYPNRDAIVTAIAQRELRRFIDGLALSAAGTDDVVGSLTEIFVYCVEYLRDQPLLEGLIGRDAPGDRGARRTAAGAIVATAVQTCAGYLADLGGFAPATATFIAETLTRLVGSTLIAPVGALDLHDPVVLRDYAARIVPAVVHAA